MTCSFEKVEKAIDQHYVGNVSRGLDFFTRAGEWADYALATIAAIGQIVANAFRLRGKDIPDGAEKVQDGANQGRVWISLLRAVHGLHALVTLKWLFSRSEDGSIKRDSDDKPVYNDGLLLTTTLSLRVGQVLGFVKRLHDFKVADLGKHASRMGHALTGIFTFVTTTSLMLSIRNFIQSWQGKLTSDQEKAIDSGRSNEVELRQQNIRSSALGLAKDVLTMAIHPFEFGVGMGPSVSPTLGIAAASVVAFGSIGIIATDVMSGGFVVENEKDPLASDNSSESSDED
ncbi:MAG: hypothetical protein H7A36_00265 [Chlamydiales bacterium]|nr:hypothetical protein [Chlamydiales bacterium]